MYIRGLNYLLAGSTPGGSWSGREGGVMGVMGSLASPGRNWGGGETVMSVCGRGDGCVCKFCVYVCVC